MAYFLVWAWHEHREAARLLNKKPEDRFVILFDEPETHLHPRWQRTILPSVLAAVDALRARSGAQLQMVVATHSPLVAASLEPLFDEALDEAVQLIVRDGVVVIEQGAWAKQGDASSWLVSPTFGLAQARSLEAERAIEAAEAWMRGERSLPPGLDSKAAIHAQLKRLLPALDEFWPRWVVRTKLEKAE
jgi:ABC-type glutathione transport system ATPase component